MIHRQHLPRMPFGSFQRIRIDERPRTDRARFHLIESNNPKKERSIHSATKTLKVLAGSVFLWGAMTTTAVASEMSFFITSVGPGEGAILGGLEGADRHCQTLAAAAGAGNRTWRAYLSTQGGAQRPERGPCA